MVSEKDRTSIHRFVSGQLRGEPDLSTLTLGILKKRYLAHVGCESLSPEARNYMKQVAQEELMKMQDAANRSELETKKPQNKRKREKENDEVISGSEDEARSKKSRCQSSSSSELEDKEDCKTRSEESEDGEQEVKKSQPKTNGKSKRQVTSEDSTDEEKSKSEQKGNESNCDGSPEGMKKKSNTTTNGGKRTSNTIREKETPQSDEENETDKDSKSDKIDGNESSDDSEKEKLSTEKKNDEPDSDSSSLPSLEDEQKSEADNKKKKTLKKDESNRGQKDDDKALVRLKRYIALCGVRRNYKKLLDGCRSVRSKAAVLKKELEDLGVHGQPSMEKCKKVRMKREEAQELAELDVSNIIATQGRPKRTGASAWQEQRDPPSSTYQRTLDSGSDTDEENDTHRGRRRTTDWANLQGIISDDADSD